MSESKCPINPAKPTWRVAAARVVEELFPSTPQCAWDDLLDLRQLLLHGGDWGVVLDGFMACRRKHEEDHYLPFYRLRRLLAAHLRLEGGLGSVCLASLLRDRAFSFRRWRKTADRRSGPARLIEA